MIQLFEKAKSRNMSNVNLKSYKTKMISEKKSIDLESNPKKKLSLCH